jgi:hypothetical protein
MAHLFNKIGTSNKYSYTSHKIPVLRWHYSCWWPSPTV